MLHQHPFLRHRHFALAYGCFEALSDLLFVHSRYIVLPKDFEAGYKNNIKKDESEHEFYK